MNLDVVDNRDVTKRIPLQRMRYSEVQQKLRYQRMGTGFGSGGVMIIPITVWANKAVLAKAATRDRSATMAAGGGYPRIYINGRLEKGDTQNRRKEKDEYHNKQAIQTRATSEQGFWLSLKTMASQETIAFVCVAQRAWNNDRMEEKKRSTPRQGKRGPRRWRKARAVDGEPEQMRGRNEAERR